MIRDLAQILGIVSNPRGDATLKPPSNLIWRRFFMITSEAGDQLLAGWSDSFS